MLQAVVAHDHIAACAHQQLRRGRPIAPGRDRHPGAARQQNRLIADHLRIVGRIDQPRTVLDEPP